jgi:hypothetical protein
MTKLELFGSGALYNVSLYLKMTEEQVFEIYTFGDVIRHFAFLAQLQSTKTLTNF